MKQINVLLALIWVVSWKLETGETFVAQFSDQDNASRLYQRLDTLSHIDCKALEGRTLEQMNWITPLCLEKGKFYLVLPETK